MTTRRDNLLDPQPTPAPTRCILVDVEGAYVPGLLSLLESRKYGSAWEEEGEYSTGARYYTKLQWELLMDASDRIISEIRQVRGPKPGQDPSESYDPTITSQYNGTQLFDVLYNDQSGIEGVNEKLTQANTLLTEIRDGLSNAENAEEQIELLGRIVVLLGGAL